MSAKKNKTVPQRLPAAKSSLPGIFGLMFAGMLLVLGVRANGGEILRMLDLLPYVLWLVSALLFVLLLRLGRFTGSGKLMELILLLSAVGVLVRSRMEGSVEGLQGWNHLIQPLGFLWMWLAWITARKGRLTLFKAFWPFAFVFSLLVIGGLIVLGNRFRGAYYGPGGLTPSEGLKILIPFALAGFFSAAEKKWQGRSCWNPPPGQSVILMFGWGILCALLVLQRDLGLVVLLSLLLVALLIVQTGSWSWGFLMLAASGGAGWLILNYLDHGARRFQAWLDPFADPTGSGWQVLQGLSGLYAGGLTGMGLGGGRPDRLPIAGSDFVYAVYGEELGYLGCVLLLGLFALLLRQCAAVVNLQKETFPALLTAGLTAILGVQVLVNISGVVTLLPVTGITLPYISQGGSSIWVTSIQFGLLLGLSEPASGKKGK